VESKNPYFSAREHLITADGNPAGLVGFRAKMEKICHDLRNPQDPNSIYSQVQECIKLGLFSPEVEASIEHTFAMVFGWSKDYKNAIDVLTKERRSANKRNSKPKIDMVDCPIPGNDIINDGVVIQSSKRFRRLDLD
jgi:hypothetical protein